MCGIVGIIGQAVDEAQIKASVSILSHRGPDDVGAYVNPASKVFLGHARLSIIGLNNGRQPILSQDGKLAIVCNGEVYDYKRLRKMLQDKNHKFSTESDSEVILYLYREYGLDFFQYIRGEFSFLIYDREKEELIAVKDRFGIKPLYYYADSEKILFASEAKAIFASGLVNAELDVPRLRSYLSACLPDCLFVGIKALPPGSFMRVNVKTLAVTIQQYWDVDFSEKSKSNQSFLELTDELKHHLDESIRFRLQADVPVGVYLSGGVDSSIVAARTAEINNKTVSAFSIHFSDDSSYDELGFAKDLSEQKGIDLYSVTCNHETLAENIKDCVWYGEQPFSNLHGVAKFMLSNLANKHVKVVLSGEGADELFLGYSYFNSEEFGLHDQLAHRSVNKSHDKNMQAYIKEIGFIPLPDLKNFLSPASIRLLNFVFSGPKGASYYLSDAINTTKTRIDLDRIQAYSKIEKKQYFSIKSNLANYILTLLGDRSEMGHSIEGRVPFMDHHLAEFACTIPVDYKISGNVHKYILREAYKDLLEGKGAYLRPKYMFSAPPFLASMTKKSPYADLFSHYFGSECLEASGLYNKKYIFLQKHFSKLPFLNKTINQLVGEGFIGNLTIQILHDEFTKQLPERLRLALEKTEQLWPGKIIYASGLE